MYKQKLLYFCTFLFILGFISFQTADAQDKKEIEITDPSEMTPLEFEIREIAVEGLVTSRESYIISSSGLRVGSRITIPGEEIPNAIRQLFRTGIFSDVEVAHERVSGGVKLTIRVEEQPRLQRYEITGVRRSHRRDLRERLNLLSGFAVTNSVRTQALNTIKRYYREEGYWNTEIEIIEEITDEAANRVTLTFNIDPGERIKVREIEFEGNETFSDRRLRREFSTIKRDRWWRIFKRHVFTQDEYEEGIENVMQFYRDNGFRDVRVVEDSVFVDNWRRSKDGVFFTINIEEGPQYRIRNIEWEGNTVYSDDELTQAFGFQKGDVFNESRFNENLEGRRDENDIISLHQNIGYLFFDIRPEIRIAEGDSLDVTFEITEDEIATIREVSFTGNTKTHDDVVRRTLRTVPGDTYSRTRIIRSIRELGTLGYFNPEGIQPDLIPDFEEKTVDITYQLDETQGSDNFEFSGGFGGRQIGVILAARVNFNNFSVQRMFERGGWNPIPSGDGQRVSLGVQVTGRGYQSYNFSFTEPWLRGRPTSLGVSVSYDFLNFNQSRFGFGQGNQPDRRNELFSASTTIGRQLQWPDDFFSQRFILTYNRFNVLGFSGVFDDGQADLLTLRSVIERNSLDNFISPRRGSKFGLSGEVALPIPGFDQFYKIKSEYQHHHTLVGRLSLSATAEYGYMGYLGSENQSNFQRFFLGGTEIQQRQNFLNDNVDLRGFPGGFNGVISPVNEDRNLIGGRAYNKYSLELRYPAVSSEQIQLIPYAFVDAGNTFEGMSDFNPFEVKRAAGFGARIFLPILGLVDLSYGYRLDGTPASNEGPGLNPGEWEFLFNIGAPF
ncbi:MAG: outer membrane protein assembly factor BamA [Balneolaceae bacterium]|nr:outer membrane protein assembly factor BamA [Balneolaceae bacterium]